MDRRSRRHFLRGGLALAGASLVSGCGMPTSPPRAPSSGKKLARIGVLTNYPLDPSPEGSAFRQALRELGYVQGESVAIELRVASSREALKTRAAELADLKPEVIVTTGDEATRAAKAATGTTPIVMVASTNPVAHGLVASLNRPGGNITGLSSLGAELNPKRLELLREIVPGLSRVGVLWAADIELPPDWSELEAAARALGVQLESFRASTGGRFDATFEEAVRWRADGLFVSTADWLLVYEPDRRRLTNAAMSRLPALYEARIFAESGGLMAYGPSRAEMFRRAPTYADKILRGAKPAELPVEQPTTFELILNLKTAQALGLTISPSVLLQATELIQ